MNSPAKMRLLFEYMAVRRKEEAGRWYRIRLTMAEGVSLVNLPISSTATAVGLCGRRLPPRDVIDRYSETHGCSLSFHPIGRWVQYLPRASSISAFSSTSLSIIVQSGRTVLILVVQASVSPLGSLVSRAISMPTLAAANTFEQDAMACCDCDPSALTHDLREHDQKGEIVHLAAKEIRSSPESLEQSRLTPMHPPFDGQPRCTALGSCI